MQKHLLKVGLLGLFVFLTGIILSGCTSGIFTSHANSGQTPGIKIVSSPRQIDDVNATGHRVYYFAGEREFDFSGLEIEIQEPGAAARIEHVTYSMIEEFREGRFSTSELGLQTFTIKWGQYKTKFQIYVMPIRVMENPAPRIIRLPKMTEFNIGDTVDENGILVLPGDTEPYDIRQDMQIEIKMNNAKEPILLMNEDLYECVQIDIDSFNDATSQAGAGRRVHFDITKYISGYDTRTGKAIYSELENPVRSGFKINVVNAKRGTFALDAIYLNDEYGLAFPDDIIVKNDLTKTITFNSEKYDLLDLVKPLLHEFVTSLLRNYLNVENGNRPPLLDALVYAASVNPTFQEALDVLTTTYIYAKMNDVDEHGNPILMFDGSKVTERSIPASGYNSGRQNINYRRFMNSFQEDALFWISGQAGGLVDTVFDVLFANNTIDEILRGLVGNDPIVMEQFNGILDMLSGVIGVDINSLLGGIMNPETELNIANEFANIWYMIQRILSSIKLEINGTELVINVGELGNLADDMYLSQSFREGIGILKELGLDKAPPLRFESMESGRNDDYTHFRMPGVLEMIKGFLPESESGDGVASVIDVLTTSDFIDMFLYTNYETVLFGIGIAKIDIQDWYLPLDISLGINMRHTTSTPNASVTKIEFNQPDAVVVTRDGHKYIELMDGNTNFSSDEGGNYYMDGGEKFYYDSAAKPLFGLAGDTKFGFYTDTNHKKFVEYNLFKIGSNGDLLIDEYKMVGSTAFTPNVRLNDDPHALLRILRSYLVNDYRNSDRDAIFLRKVMTGDFMAAQGISFGDMLISEARTMMGMSENLAEAVLGVNELAGPKGNRRSNQVILDEVFNGTLEIGDMLSLVGRVLGSGNLSLIGEAMGLIGQDMNVDLNVQIYTGFIDQLIEQLFGLVIDVNTMEFAPSTKPNLPPALVTEDMLGLINLALEWFIDIKVRNDGEDFAKLLNSLLSALVKMEYVTGVTGSNASVTIADMISVGVGYNGNILFKIGTNSLSVDMPVNVDEINKATASDSTFKTKNGVTESNPKFKFDNGLPFTYTLTLPDLLITLGFGERGTFIKHSVVDPN